MSGVAKTGPSRRMKYPYTISAKLAQFPYKFVLQNHWFFKYYAIGLLMSLPIFHKIEKLSKSPENIAKWEEIRKHELIPKHY